MTFTKNDPNINRNGRPKGISITEMVRAKLAEVDPTNKDRKTYGSQVVEAILKRAMKDNDVPMIKAIWSYMDGLPKSSLDVTTGGEKIDSIAALLTSLHANTGGSDKQGVESE